MRSETPTEAPLHCWHLKSGRAIGKAVAHESVCCWCGEAMHEITKPTKRRKPGHGSKVNWGMTESETIECDRFPDELCPGRVVVADAKQGSLLPGGAS